ncbi:MAG: trigger factor [Gemmataceae bacterium]
MSDEPEKENDEVAGDTAVAEAGETEAPVRLKQTVDVHDVGPCKKHIKVTIDREDIDGRLNEKFTELVAGHKSNVPGFRPGKAPRKIVERLYKEDVYREVRGELLMASLEQLAEEQDIAPLAPPNLDPARIVVPPTGPMVYEFEVEVRPQFTLPEYKGLKLKKPVQTFTDVDVERERRRLLESFGQLVPKDEPATVDIGDIIFTDIKTEHNGQQLNALSDIKIRIDPQLALRDGVAKRFGKEIAGAKVGETRPVKIKLSDSVANPDLRGQTVEAQFTVKDIKMIRTPELTHDLLHHFGVHTPEQLDELIRVVLERRLEYSQRQSARQQIISKVGDEAIKELPQDLLRRQAQRALQRKVMEMRSAGMNDQEIEGRIRLLQQDVIRSTALALKEHFVLQKIAEDEKIDVNDDDLDAEIDRIAARNNESARKVRARLEKEDLIESLAAELLESKALDLILESAEFEEEPLVESEEDAAVATVEHQAVPGKMQEPEVEELNAEEKAETKDEGEKKEE